MVTIKTPQTPSKWVCNPTKLSISSCGNVTHGVDLEHVNSATRLKKLQKNSQLQNQFKI
jgi:hypothetical protein